MDYAKTLSSSRRKWLVLLLNLVLVDSLMFVRVKSNDQPPVPATGLLCISDCVTCPVICSPPPPPPPKSKPLLPPPLPPPPIHYSPPWSYYFENPPLLPPPPPPPPPSYILWGSKSPPSPAYANIPSSQGPLNMGQKNYSHPYYYFYASKAASLPLSYSFFLMVTFSFVVEMLDCLLGR
ncbi:Proprotein convertase subtilisin/kexin type 6 like [Actinidia chinensis var. chinensis]|uniref:Proprotein convertase subtilisin/kexin type 6 like n=1 Tax=Actinidia chinensis var. chinensis TaxID=1590841 RepID=A0A2R6PMP2_ACTCC|nr:Proprotein convertase subtilisin/kexin type 6 like [Actinidia chinensis var. chinensis]